MNSKEILHNLIYPNLDIPSLIPELEPIDKGKYFILICPYCQKKEAYMKKTSYHINCNRLNKCGAHISLWEYLKKFHNLSDKEVFHKLAINAGVNLSSFHFPKNPQNIVQIRIIKKPLFLIKNLYFKKDLNKLISSFNSLHFKEKFQTIISYIYFYSLKTDQTKKILYYQNRKITPPNDIGFLSINDIKKLSKNLAYFFGTEILNKFQIFIENRFRYNFDVAVIPSFDLYSNLLTAIRLRAISPEIKIKEFEISYKRILNPISYPLTREKLLKYKTFYFTEGHIDGLSLEVENFVAIEGVNSFNPYHLGYFRYKNIIIAFDQDKAGRYGAKKMSEYLKKLNINHKFLVWDEKYGKDLNELKQANLMHKVYLQDHL